MAHAAKYNRAAAGHMTRHYDRSADNISNEQVDPDRTVLNYNLAPGRDGSQMDFINQRTSEVKCLNRKDVNVMCSWIVTAPKDLEEEDYKRFFEECYKFLNERYGGEKDVVSAWVHMDETTPHLHYAFVPVVKDKKKDIDKVSAKECIDRKDLQTFHDDLDWHMNRAFKRDIGVVNEATKEGNKSVAELKKNTLMEENKRLEKQNRSLQKKIDDQKEIVKTFEDEEKKLQKKITTLRSKIAGLEGAVMTANELRSIQPEKIPLVGTIKGVTEEQIKNLKHMAILYHKVNADFHELMSNYKKLADVYERDKKLIPTLAEKMQQIKDKDSLETLIETFKKVPYEVKLRVLPIKSKSGIERELFER